MLHLGVTKGNRYIIKFIQQPIPKLQILNFHDLLDLTYTYEQNYTIGTCLFWCFVQFDCLKFFLQIAKVLAKDVNLVITMSVSVESSDSTGN